MGKHHRDNDKDGQWPMDKPLPRGTNLNDGGHGKHSKDDDETAEEAEDDEE